MTSAPATHAIPIFDGTSPATRALLERATRLASSGEPLLLLGESGTGKSLLARWIHAHGPRRERPMVTINCAGLSGDLVESELFGHGRGAFTGAVGTRAGLIESATGGTVFLDEIGDLEPGIQGKLLRLLEEGRYRRLGEAEERSAAVRFIAATNRDLRGLVEQKLFRQDLFYRISGYSLRLPPLRERREDIPGLARLLLARMIQRAGRHEVPELTGAAIRALCAAPWPGNVRELAHVLERALLDQPGPVLDVADLVFDLPVRRGEPQATEASESATDMSLEGQKRRLILEVLELESGNVARAARRLGVSRATLYARMREYQVKRRRGRSGPEPEGTPPPDQG